MRFVGNAYRVSNLPTRIPLPIKDTFLAKLRTGQEPHNFGTEYLVDPILILFNSERKLINMTTNFWIIFSNSLLSPENIYQWIPTAQRHNNK